MAYEINYDDERFTQVENDKNAALNEVESTYNDMISQSDKHFQSQIDAVGDWKDKQTEIQNQQTDFTIEQINQQKDQTKKDYLKEQSGAYVDWQKQSGQYGANAEAMAANGMANGGYSESSQVSMYNTYQNRVAVAREAYTRAVLNYDNAIKDARLQNNAALAEIAYQALQQELELSLQGFQYKNQLVLGLADKKMQIDSEYYNRYLAVLDQINTEEAFKASGSGGGKINKGSGSSGGVLGKVTKQIIENFNKDDKESSNEKVDMQSVLDLGGSYSPEYVDSLIRQGLVEEYTVNGVTKFRKIPGALRYIDLFSQEWLNELG